MAKRKLDVFLQDINHGEDSIIEGEFQAAADQLDEVFGDENNPEGQSEGLVANRYQFFRMLGYGSFGRVLKAKDRNFEDKFVAIKCIDSDNEGLRSYHQETSILSQIDHTNIVKMVEFIRQPNMMYIVLELHPTTLLRHIETNGSLEMNQVRGLSKQLLEAVNYCHRHNILHLDIKPSNILMSSDQNVKLADFGMAIQLPSDTLPEPHEVVTLNYRAPELLLGSPAIDRAIDAWSIGCTIGEMLIGRLVFKAYHQITVLFEIFKFVGTPTYTNWAELTQLPYYNNKFPKWQPTETIGNSLKIDDTAADFLKRLLTPIPSQRITVAEALIHPFFLGQITQVDCVDAHKVFKDA